MKRYRLEFEYISPFTGKWTKAAREGDECQLASLMEQMGYQLTMTDVRNSRLMERAVGEWQEVSSAAS